MSNAHFNYAKFCKIVSIANIMLICALTKILGVTVSTDLLKQCILDFSLWVGTNFKIYKKNAKGLLRFGKNTSSVAP